MPQAVLVIAEHDGGTVDQQRIGPATGFEAFGQQSTFPSGVAVLDLDRRPGTAL